MKRTVCLILCLVLALAAVGCSKSASSDSSGEPQNMGATENGDLSEITTLDKAAEYLESILGLKENYNSYVDSKTAKSYMLMEGKAAPLENNGEIKLNGKNITLPDECKRVAEALALTYADEKDANAMLSGGATVARSFKTSDGENVTLALYSEKGATAENSNVVGISFECAKSYSFSALGIEKGTPLASVIKKLGKPDYVSAISSDGGINFDLQYTSGDFLRVVYNSLTGMSYLIIEA